MDSISLSRLSKVDLRDVWDNEARDFTPWLAAENNLALLSKTIGIELELEGMEQNVGPFNADILCRDTLQDRWVLVENQLERTDHTHLGQLITYASGLDAATIVWIARRFTDEHRAALDWLNDITSEGIHFFGLEIELWKIGDSPPAPKFNVVCNPNDWSKTVSRTAKRGDELTETKQLQLQYWTEFAEHLRDNDAHVKPRTPQPRNRAVYTIGRSGCNLSARVNTQAHRVGVELYLEGEDEAERIFYLLKEDQTTIEAEIGESLEWLPRPARKCCIVRYEWSADPTDKGAWPEQHARMHALLDAFYETFAPRLKRIDPSQYVPEDQSVNGESN